MPFIYPTSFELREIEQDFVQQGQAGRVGMEIMSVRETNVAKVRWTQQDNYFGLQQLRGLDGRPLHVNRIGRSTYEYEPGVFGEFVDVTETELTNRAGSAPIDTTPIDVSDLVLDAKRQLMGREDDRVESSIWTLLTTGTISITLDGPNGTQVAYSDTYTIQTYTPTIPWATYATATPTRDFMYVQQLGYAAGHSVDFGSAATAYMNSTTANRLLLNANSSDFYGRRYQGGSTLNSVPDFNRFLAGQNLPQIKIYDNGYMQRQSTTLSLAAFKKYIPDGKVVVVGKRPTGSKIGEYLKTRNASNGFKPGSYEYVLDRANGVNAEKRTPANIEIHRGHNGGPVMYFPSAVVVMTVGT